ncbi:hypothetical protein OY671_007784, partial [Metschnikowia pulcherrima]
PTDGYNASSAHITARPFKAHPGVEFSIVGQNSTNDVQRYATAFNKDSVVMPGRSVRLRGLVQRRVDPRPAPAQGSLAAASNGSHAAPVHIRAALMNPAMAGARKSPWTDR